MLNKNKQYSNSMKEHQKCFHNVEDIYEVLDNTEFELININKKEGSVYNTAVAFDIETTSFIDTQGEKVAIMYVWQMAIDDKVIIGRTWQEFVECIDIISKYLYLNDQKRLIIWVHNLSFEFQFIRQLFDWVKVFAIDERKPAKALTTTGVEFRCSYIESGCSLEQLAKELTTHNIKKLKDDFDYTKMRHNKTPLTDIEYQYCVNDVLILTAYINEQKKKYGNITKLSLTKTGYVRRYCREKCLYKEDGSPNYDYQNLIKCLTLEPEEYKQLKRAFAGGFTHANAEYTAQDIEDVISYDFTSSYPAVMVSERFPMSKSELIKINNKEDFEYNLKYYCCLFDIEFTNIKASVKYENYISESRCWYKSNTITNNGRIVSADKIIITITEQDFFIIKKMYNWDGFRVSNFRRYERGYLPKEFVMSILELYKNKTTLKGIDDKITEYNMAKAMLNSCFGMAVTDITRDVIEYTDNWCKTLPDYDNEIFKYNKSLTRFLFYPWGVWITAYARVNLFTGINECKEDYIYSDTDSVKIKNADKHKVYFEKYNEYITKKINYALDRYDIPHEYAAPQTITGKTKQLGVWDFDGHYKKFKTLGAKRYMVLDDNDNLNITVSGLNKKVTVPYLNNKYGSDVFKEFTEGLSIPPGSTGKLSHTYIDTPRIGYMKDYLGNYAHYNEKTSVHLEAAGYDLSLHDYLNYFTKLQFEMEANK